MRLRRILPNANSSLLWWFLFMPSCDEMVDDPIVEIACPGQLLQGFFPLVAFLRGDPVLFASSICKAFQRSRVYDHNCHPSKEGTPRQNLQASLPHDRARPTPGSASYFADHMPMFSSVVHTSDNSAYPLLNLVRQKPACSGREPGGQSLINPVVWPSSR